VDFEKQLNLFIRLRTLYVYLDRLHKFGQNPNEEQRTFLETLRGRVHAKLGWEN